MSEGLDFFLDRPQVPPLGTIEGIALPKPEGTGAAYLQFLPQGGDSAEAAGNAFEASLPFLIVDSEWGADGLTVGWGALLRTDSDRRQRRAKLDISISNGSPNDDYALRAAQAVLAFAQELWAPELTTVETDAEFSPVLERIGWWASPGSVRPHDTPGRFLLDLEATEERRLALLLGSRRFYGSRFGPLTSTIHGKDFYDALGHDLAHCEERIVLNGLSMIRRAALVLGPQIRAAVDRGVPVDIHVPSFEVSGGDDLREETMDTTRYLGKAGATVSVRNAVPHILAILDRQIFWEVGFVSPPKAPQHVVRIEASKRLNMPVIMAAPLVRRIQSGDSYGSPA